MKFYKQTITTVPIQGKTVLLRADFNVPLEEDGKIADDFRIRASLPTIKRLLEDHCKVVIISHLGRPKGHDPSLSLQPVAKRLAELLGESVRFVDQTVGDKVKMSVKRAPQRSVTVLENLRFDPREEANDMGFARQLTEDSGAQYFVQDGFGVVHREHASTAGVTQYLPSVAGLLLEREYMTIRGVMTAPKQPLVAVLGGAKVSDKISVVEAFIEIADKIIITGVMANTFFAYKHNNIGKSKFEEGQTEVIEKIYAAAQARVGADNVDEFLILPDDLAVGPSADENTPRQIVGKDNVGTDEIILDIGDKSIERMVGIVEKAKTVVWSGTLGKAELPNFAHGSARLALTLATNPAITSVVGGGDTVDFVLHWDARDGDSFTHVSTGGSASLELMAGKKLPGIESLLDA